MSILSVCYLCKLMYHSIIQEKHALGIGCNGLCNSQKVAHCKWTFLTMMLIRSDFHLRGRIGRAELVISGTHCNCSNHTGQCVKNM